MPPAVLAQVHRILGERGDSTPVRDIQRVKGGFKNASARLTTGQGTYFLKWNTTPGAAVLRAEAEHLALLASSGVVSVPEILAAVDPSAGRGHESGFLVQEWLSPHRATRSCAVSDASWVPPAPACTRCRPWLRAQ